MSQHRSIQRLSEKHHFTLMKQSFSGSKSVFSLLLVFLRLSWQFFGCLSISFFLPQCPFSVPLSPLWYCSFVRSGTGLWIKSIPKERHFDILKCYQQESVTTVPAQREMLLAMPLVLIYNSFLSFHSFQAQTDILIRSSLCWHASCWSWYTPGMQELCQSCDPSINTTPASADWCELKTL